MREIYFSITSRAVTAAGMAVSGLLLSGCGLNVPRMEEPWEAMDVSPPMETDIKAHIFCETIVALRDVNRDIKISVGSKQLPVIPDDYGVQMQITLTVDEVGALNPSVGYSDTLRNTIAKGINISQSFALNGSATASSTATRVDTTYSYYNVGKITALGANSWCSTPLPQGSSPLFKSDLGIEGYLREVAPGERIFPSSAPAKGGAGKSAKLDVFSYEIKFAVVTNASISPVWHLVNLTAGTGGLPLLNVGRTRTHDLTLTFGPGTDQPTDFALQTHFTGQIVQSNMRELQQ